MILLPEQEDFDDFAADEIPQTPDCQVFLSDDGVRTLQHKGKELDLPNPTPVDEGGLGEWNVECDLEEKWSKESKDFLSLLYAHVCWMYDWFT